MILMWIDSLFEWAKFIGSAWYHRIRWLVIQVLTIVIIFITLLWLAVFMYGSFYYTYMPSVSHTRDVHLGFRSDCDDAGKLCSFPSANISLLTDGSRELLRRGQVYVMSFDMVLPESPVNQRLGMFMVKVQIYAKHGEIVHESRRSTMLGFKSSLLHTLETWAFLPFFLSGNSKQQQHVTVELFDNYQEDPYKPAVGAFLEVQTKRIELYRTKLHMHAKFSGLRYVMYHYPVMSWFIGVTTNMFFLLVITLLSWYRFGAKIDFEDSQPIVASTLTMEERRQRARVRLTKDKQSKRSLTTEAGTVVSLPHTKSMPSLLGMTAPPSEGPENLGAEPVETVSKEKLGLRSDEKLDTQMLKESSGSEGSNGEGTFEVVKIKTTSGDTPEGQTVRQRKVVVE